MQKKIEILTELYKAIKKAWDDNPEDNGQFAIDVASAYVVAENKMAHLTPLAADLLEPAQECECDPSQEYYIHCPIHGNATR